jgi:hypothetical protein
MKTRPDALSTVENESRSAKHLPDTFLVVLRAPILVFMCCAPGPILGGTEGVGSTFHVLRFQTLFRRYHRRPVLFSCFALLDSFSAVPRAPGHFFMYCPQRLIWAEPRALGSPSYFALPDLFSTVTSCPICMFCAPRPILCGTECVESQFHVLRGRTHFRQNRGRGRRVLFSCFALLDSFFGGTEGVRSRFHVLRL